MCVMDGMDDLDGLGDLGSLGNPDSRLGTVGALARAEKPMEPF